MSKPTAIGEWGNYVSVCECALQNVIVTGRAEWRPILGAALLVGWENGSAYPP